MALLLKKAFHAAAENSGDAVEGIGTRFVDVIVPLLIHLYRAGRDTRTFCKLSLRAAVSAADTFQVSIFESSLQAIPCKKDFTSSRLSVF